jgi:branched-chain amino acid transport system permease protein
MLGQLIVSGLAVGSVYALVALGMTILFRATTVVNFCHGEFFMLGAVAVYVLRQLLGWPYPLAIAVAFALMFLVGMMVERLLMRPLHKAPHLSIAMMTVALSFFFKGVTRLFYGREVSPLPPLIDGEPIELWSVVLLPQDILVMLASLAVVAIFFVFFHRTQFGKTIQAASQTPRGAALVGLNVPAFHSVMWGVAAMMGALAGLLIAPSTLVYPDMGAHMLVRAFAAMTLGGFGSLGGAVIGGLVLGVIENLMGGYLSSSLVEIAAYLVIVVVLLSRPQGLLGEWKLSRV